MASASGDRGDIILLSSGGDRANYEDAEGAETPAVVGRGSQPAVNALQTQSASYQGEDAVSLSPWEQKCFWWLVPEKRQLLTLFLCSKLFFFNTDGSGRWGF